MILKSTCWNRVRLLVLVLGAGLVCAPAMKAAPAVQTKKVKAEGSAAKMPVKERKAPDFRDPKEYDTSKWEPAIRVFEERDKTNKPPAHGIEFIGSSSIKLWTNVAADFPEHPCFNRGFGGSHLTDSLHYAERIVIPYKPKMVVMYAGGNDIAWGCRPQDVARDFQAFVKKVHQALPETRIAYISIAPNPARWTQVDRVREANRLIEEFIQTDPKRMVFINVFPHMLGPDGLPKPDIFRDDKLHMNRKGYELWVDIVRPYLGPGAK